MTKLRIDVWSDIACPWCWVGKRRLEAAIDALSSSPDLGARHGPSLSRDDVEVVWRAFELDSSAPRVAPSLPYAHRLAAKYRTPVEQGEHMIRTMTTTAAEDGLELHFERIRPGNTFDAHRLLHLAREHGKQDALKERLFRGYLQEGAAIGDPEELVRLAVDAGLDEQDTRRVLATDEHADDVRVDEGQARAIGVRGVPFFVFGGRYGLSGAQPATVLREVLERAWTESGAIGVDDDDGAPACGPDGC